MTPPPEGPARRRVTIAVASAAPRPGTTGPPNGSPQRPGADEGGGERSRVATPNVTAPAAAPDAPRHEPSGRVVRTKRKRGRRPWYRPKLRWFALYLPMLLILATAGLGLWGWQQIRSLGRVDLGDSLSTATGGTRNYLIVGSDSREGLGPDVVNAGAIGVDVAGRRSDTIIVLRIDTDSASMMSIPRDLWVRNPDTGKEGRINATYAAGPANLVRAVTEDLGVPIHHYVEVDFKSFGAMVDAVGGITIDFPHPVKDRGSGLNILRSGPARLDGDQSLAYVRSRHYTEIVDGREVTDPTADLGRQERQQTFIRSLISEMSDVRNPITLLRLAGAATSGMRVDQEFGTGDAIDLARRLSGTTPESVVLPTDPARRGSAAVLVLRAAEARPVLDRFAG